MPPGPRLHDWPERLAALVEARRDAPFAWGTHDCVLFAADAVLAVTGVDWAGPWRGTYSTEAEAEAILVPRGGLRGMLDHAQAQRGPVTCPTALAQRGDTGLVPVGNMLCMGVVLGEAVAAPGIDGLVFVPAATLLRAWVT